MSSLTAREELRLHVLHGVARIALRVARPLRAKAFVDGLARLSSPLGGADVARAAVRSLHPVGTCLTRAVTIASMIPDAEVIIGVDAWKGLRLAAHAWLEIDGERVDTNPVTPSPLPDELARLPRACSGALAHMSHSRIVRDDTAPAVTSRREQ